MVNKFIDFKNKKITKFYKDIQYPKIDLNYDEISKMPLNCFMQQIEDEVKKSLDGLDSDSPVCLTVNFDTKQEVEEKVLFDLGFLAFAEVITTKEQVNDYLFIPLYMKNKVKGNVGVLRQLGNFKTTFNKVQFILSINGKVCGKAVN